MLARPKRNDTEEDILEMQEKFLTERAKNPSMQPAAKMVKIETAAKKSIFAQSRGASTSRTAVAEPNLAAEPLGVVQERVAGDQAATKTAVPGSDIIIGDIVERHFVSAKPFNSYATSDDSAFPSVDTTPLTIVPPTGNRSLFALSMDAKGNTPIQPPSRTSALSMDALQTTFGDWSAVIEDATTAAEVHNDNLQLLGQMTEAEILANRNSLLLSMDPSVVELLAKKRRELTARSVDRRSRNPAAPTAMDTMDELVASAAAAAAFDPSACLPPSNAALGIIAAGQTEHWVNFHKIESDKLNWMENIPAQVKKMQPGEHFEARFDWKGILLSYTAEQHVTSTAGDVRDDRELYMHGDEPHRPGYTVQELFRLARSNILQQRISAFGAISGILNIYNQGYYDNVLELPISKIFFLLRFGMDDNTPAMLEVVTRAMAYLFYNETDETLLDFTHENPGCNWQPTLQVLTTGTDDDDVTSLENLQKQLGKLQLSARQAQRPPTVWANLEENDEHESKMSMSDFQLAETDLVDCLLRTNILQRIYFILHSVRPDNSTVSSCLKLLIRVARTGKEAATKIANNDSLMGCLFDNFLPGFERIDTSLANPPFYNYPQSLCLKLLRVLISQSLAIAVRIHEQYNIVERVQSYLFNRDDLKSKLIKVQIESLRLVRCLILLRIDNNTLYKKFLSAFRYMLEWHYNHVVYEVGGAFLIRQHAAALLAAITAMPSPSVEVAAVLGDMLRDCCCNWFNSATRPTAGGVKEFSQATLLSACLTAVTWYTRNNGLGATEKFRVFIEKYLCEFIASRGFVALVQSVETSSIVLRMTMDRRHVHAPLPNVGAVLLYGNRPQLVVPQAYPVYLLNALWRLLDLQLASNELKLYEALTQQPVIEPLVDYLEQFTLQPTNFYLSTNFYAKAEVQLLFKLLCFDGFAAYIDRSKILLAVYNYLCCLTAEHIPEIEKLFERVIFNRQYIEGIDRNTLNKWRDASLTELVHPHYIVVEPSQLTLSLPATQAPILPRDWPFYQLKRMLQNYLDNTQHKPVMEFSERDVLRLTFTFVNRLEATNAQLEIVTPTEQLMYFMIAFMGPDSEFLDGDIHQLLRRLLLRFYAKSTDYTFQFDTALQGKCKFENLYVLFVDHFQAASYGDDLFGSLVMVPLAQKYDHKWRRRVWSDYASALRFLHCSEDMLIGGLQAYLEPPEVEQSLVAAYANALNTNLVRPNTLPYKIAKHHVDQYRNRPIN